MTNPPKPPKFSNKPITKEERAEFIESDKRAAQRQINLEKKSKYPI